MNQDFTEPAVSKEIDYNKILGTVLSRWYWIAGCLAFTSLLAWFYLSLIHPRYSSNASIMLNEKKSDINQIFNNSTDESKGAYESFNQVQSATFIIQSNAFLTKAVSKLNYRYSFYVKELWSMEELYPQSPFKIQIIKQDTTGLFYSGLFGIIRKEKGTFNLSYGEAGLDAKTYRFGDTIQAKGLLFRILSTYSVQNKLYFFRFHTNERLVQRAALNLGIEAQNSNILSITHTDVNPYFSADILNAISDEFVVTESYQRRLSATQRLNFISAQLDTLSKQVNISATDLETFKKQNNLDNLQAKVTLDLQRVSQQEAQREQLIIERLSIDRLAAQIAANDPKARLNFNLEGNIGGLLSGLISKLNDQIYDRDDKLTKYNTNSPTILEIDKKIRESKDAIADNLKQLIQRNQDNQRYIDQQISKSRAALDALPSDAKDFITLQTDYITKQKILSNLAEEKLKSQIAFSALEPGARVLYYAVPSTNSVWPLENRIYLMALAAGLGMGLFFIGVARYLNRRIRDVGTVESLTSVPILGVIRGIERYTPDAVDYHSYFVEHPDSLFAESIRSVRNSLMFILNERQGKVICISSDVSGEGRSFTAANIACSLAQLEKKVIILDADLRKPLSNKLSTEDVGLSAYLADFKSLPAVIRHTNAKNMDIIPSGVVPPNPSELLQNAKMQELLAFLRNIYDYIIIDTSPIGVVSDAVPLIEEADINIFVIRSDKSRFNSTSHLQKIALEYKLDNFFIILNSFRKNPLYQPFYSDTNTDIYFNKYYSGYINSYNTDPDESKWRRIQNTDQ